MIFLYFLAGVLILYAALFVYKTKTGSPSVMSRPEHVERFMKYVRGGMKVADLGCGDGSILIGAVKHGAASGDGWEIEPVVWLKAKREVRREMLDSRIHIHFGDMWGADLSPYDLIYVYQLTRFAKKFREKIARECKPGALVVANTYPIPSLRQIKRDGELWVYEIGHK